MEQQVISIAKGGIVCKINTRATIIAACNQIQSKAHIDDLSKSTGIISSLLSRFDLIYLIPDTHDRDEDIAKADYCLFRSSINFKQNKAIWSVEKMSKYIKLVQTVFKPYITEQAEELFKAFFTYLKHNPRVGKESKTVRMLESIIRLGQAHARLMFRNEISTFDAISVILLVECTLSTGLIKDNYPHVRYTNAKDYFELKVEILRKLKLDQRKFEDLLWKNMEKDIKTRSRTPSPINDYIEETDLNNLMANDLTSEGLSTFTGNPFGFDITQVGTQKHGPPLLTFEETKLQDSSQKLPSVKSVDIEDDDLDILEQILDRSQGKDSDEIEISLTPISEELDNISINLSSP